MKERVVAKTVTGAPAVDGAGVHLTRVLGHDTAMDFDPFLMLDSFDSKNPDDYTKGFPMHPHRGIETITYLIHGEMEHQDSLGNRGNILSGQGQWMTAGGGILHQEMPKASEHMLGVQLWLNLPADQKLVRPAYQDITEEDIPVVPSEQGVVRVVSGEYKGVKGLSPKYIQASIYDITLYTDRELTIPTEEGVTVFLFPITGSAYIGDAQIKEKTAVLLSDGDAVRLRAPENQDCRVLCFCGAPLGEPIAWGGPIVMNTQSELEKAFSDLREGRFISHCGNSPCEP